MATRLEQGILDGSGLGDDLEVRPPVEQGDEPLADDLVVVDDEESERATRPPGHRRRLAIFVGHVSAPVARGRRSTILVPIPGELWTSRSPPIAPARVRMLASP